MWGLDKWLREQGRFAAQMVSKRGSEAAVLVSVDEWHRLKADARPSLKQLLLAEEDRTGLVVPARGAARRRPPSPAR